MAAGAQRVGRLAIIVLGTAIGFPMFVGGLLADVPVLVVLAIAGLGIGSALLAARVRFGQVAMTLSLPMVGVGPSYPDLGKAAGLAGLMVLGSVLPAPRRRRSASCSIWNTSAGRAQPRYW